MESVEESAWPPSRSRPLWKSTRRLQQKRPILNPLQASWALTSRGWLLILFPCPPLRIDARSSVKLMRLLLVKAPSRGRTLSQWTLLSPTACFKATKRLWVLAPNKIPLSYLPLRAVDHIKTRQGSTQLPTLWKKQWARDEVRGQRHMQQTFPMLWTDRSVASVRLSDRQSSRNCSMTSSLTPKMTPTLLLKSAATNLCSLLSATMTKTTHMTKSVEHLIS